MIKELIEVYKVLWMAFGWILVAMVPLPFILLLSEWFGLMFIVSIPLSAVVMRKSTDSMLKGCDND